MFHLFCLCQTDVKFWLCLLDGPPEPFLLSPFAAYEFDGDKVDVVNGMASLVKV